MAVLEGGIIISFTCLFGHKDMATMSSRLVPGDGIVENSGRTWEAVTSDD